MYELAENSDTISSIVALAIRLTTIKVDLMCLQHVLSFTYNIISLQPSHLPMSSLLSMIYVNSLFKLPLWKYDIYICCVVVMVLYTSKGCNIVVKGYKCQRLYEIHHRAKQILLNKWRHTEQIQLMERMRYHCDFVPVSMTGWRWKSYWHMRELLSQSFMNNRSQCPFSLLFNATYAMPGN